MVQTSDYQGNTFMASRDDHGHALDISVFSEMLIGNRFVDVQTTFAFNLSQEDVSQVTTGTGTIGVNNSMAMLSTGSGIGHAKLSSHQSITYRADHQIWVGMSGVFTLPEAEVTQYLGIQNDTDGFTFGFNGTEFVVRRLSNGVEYIYTATNSNFIIDKLDGEGRSKFIYDPTKLHKFRLKFAHLGISPCYFEIFGGVNFGWVSFAVIDLTGVLSVPQIGTPYLPLCAEVTRSAGSGEVTLGIGSWAGGTIGGSDRSTVGTRHFSTRVADVAVPAGILTSLITIRSKVTFAGKSNHIISFFESIECAVDGVKTSEILLYEGATVTGVHTWIDYNTNDSVLEYSLLSGPVSGGVLLQGLPLAKVESRGMNVSNDFFIHAGDSYTLACISSGNTLATIIAHHTEKF